MTALNTSWNLKTGINVNRLVAQASNKKSLFYNYDYLILKYKTGYCLKGKNEPKGMENVVPSIAHLCAFADSMINIVHEKKDLKERICSFIDLLNNEENKYDKEIILWLRFCIMNLVKRYAFVKEFRINSNSFSTTLAQDYDKHKNDLEMIFAHELMELGKDARDWMINAIPSVLGMRLTVMFVNMSNQGSIILPISPSTGTRGEESFFSKIFKSQTFYVLLKPGHYDALYSHEDIANFKCLDSSDPEKDLEAK
jgi:hypothetical protein